MYVQAELKNGSKYLQNVSLFVFKVERERYRVFNLVPTLSIRLSFKKLNMKEGK